MNYYKKLLPIALASIGIVSNASVAKAVNFNFTYAPGTTFEQKVGFEMAGQIWSGYLKDDFTANIYIETTDSLPENVIGGALPGIQSGEQYQTYREYLEEDNTSDIDNAAISNLENRTDKYNKFSAMYDGNYIKDMNRLNITTANAKAIDLLSDSNDLDGYIMMNNLQDTSVNWNYNFLGGNVPDGSLDYLSVALHEVGHVMGFVSGVDNPGWLNIVTEHKNKNKLIKRDEVKFFNPLDLFRYSEESAMVNAVDISIGGNPFFSIDNGDSVLGNFATGQATTAGGDGYQASHWQRSDNALGIMDPVLNVGQTRKITDLDLVAFDAIGYDIDNAVTLNLSNIYQTAVNSANSALEEDMSKDVKDMIKDSKVYEGRRSRGSWQEAYYSNFSWQTLDSSADSESVPEPTSIVGLLGLSLFGFRKLSKIKKQNC